MKRTERHSCLWESRPYEMAFSNCLCSAFRITDFFLNFCGTCCCCGTKSHQNETSHCALAVIIIRFVLGPKCFQSIFNRNRICFGWKTQFPTYTEKMQPERQKQKKQTNRPFFIRFSHTWIVSRMESSGIFCFNETVNKINLAETPNEKIPI